MEDNLTKFKIEFGSEIESKLSNYYSIIKTEAKNNIDVNSVIEEIKKQLNNEIDFKITKLKTDFEIRLIDIMNSIDTKIESKLKQMANKYDNSISNTEEQLIQFIKTYNSKLEFINTQVDKLESTIDLKCNDLELNTTLKLMEELQKIQENPSMLQQPNGPIRLSNYTMNRIAQKIKGKL